jgi:S-formylglutathione hydrolase FrmB
VLYLLHGANSGPIEIMERSEVTKFSVGSRLITVIPDAGYSYYTNAKHIRDARWEDAITRDLQRDVESRFPALQGREHRGIAGISMGGYGAVKLALKHPDLYGFVADMSGALDITRRPASMRRWGQTWRIWRIFGVRTGARRDEDVFDLLEQTQKLGTAGWFESCGMNDSLLAVNEHFARNLQARGVAVETKATPGGHDWQSWNDAMPEVFSIAGRTLQ